MCRRFKPAKAIIILIIKVLSEFSMKRLCKFEENLIVVGLGSDDINVGGLYAPESDLITNHFRVRNPVKSGKFVPKIPVTLVPDIKWYKCSILVVRFITHGSILNIRPWAHSD